MAGELVYPEHMHNVPRRLLPRHLLSSLRVLREGAKTTVMVARQSKKTKRSAGRVGLIGIAT